MKRQSYFLITILLTILVLGCQQQNPLNFNTDPKSYVYLGTGTGVVGTKGGEVYIGNLSSPIAMAVVAIDSGALTKPVKFTVSQADFVVPGYPDAKVIQVSPDTLFFSKGVTLGMQYLAQSDPEWSRLCSFNPTTGHLTTLTRLNWDISRSIMYGKSNELGYFTCVADPKPSVSLGDFSDPRDNQTYPWVKIDNQVWMAKNLNFDLPSGSWTYGNIPSNGALYGRLYEWQAAVTACPPGWHLPTHQEWFELEQKLGLSGVDPTPNSWKYEGFVGMKLKSTQGWSGTSKDPVSFGVLPTGFRDIDGTYKYLGTSGRFWTSSTHSTSGYWVRYIDDTEGGIFWGLRAGNIGLSVRCIQGEDNSLPTVTTVQTSQINSLSATSGGTVVSQGGSAILERGVCWNTAGYPLITDAHTSDGSGLGTFTSQLSQLLPNTQYYIRAYATNSSGTAYGEEMTFSSLPEAQIETGTMQDPRDSHTYKTVKYGDKWWMAENLNYTTSSGSYCYNGLPSNCDTYGHLYEWNMAMSVCPQGWYLPTDDDWQAMEIFLGMTVQEAGTANWRNQGEVGAKLKSTTGWTANGNGSNSSKFNGLPGGFRDGDGTYNYLGEAGRFWTSTPDPQNKPWCRYIEYNDVGVYRSSRGPSRSMSVRCVKGNVTSLPYVTTGTISNLRDNSVTCSGEVVTTGGASVTARGFCWNTNGTPTINDAHVTLIGEIGSFSQTITNLSSNTTYFIRAYATNLYGTHYGEMRIFTTPQSLPIETGVFVDSRNNLTYNTVKIGSQWWFAENLNYEIIGKSWCYEHNPNNCNLYGRFYNYDAAISVCPAGWHLPTDDEWKILETALGMSSTQADAEGWRLGSNVGTQMKSESGWINNGNGSNSSLFNAIPAGFRDGDDTFNYLGESARFWTRGYLLNQDPYVRYFQYNKEGVYRSTRGTSRGFSVRCVKN